jgi:site-specific DNA recombinase
VIDLVDLLVREYLRVSQDRSGVGKSPDQQHEEMSAGATVRRWKLHPDPYRDDNRSASRYATKPRESFLDLMRDLEAGTFGADVLGIWESSRGSRRTSEWLELIDLCKDRGVLIWVLTHNRVYDPSNARDRRTLREDASDAEYESDKTSERLLRDVRYNAEQGRPHGKQIYGYLRIYDQQTRRLIEVVEHPEQAPIVKEAARRVVAGESFYAIAKDFNARGIPPRRKAYREQRKDLGWTSAAIKQMLVMPAYAGKRQHRGEIIGDAIWPPLIEPATWEKLQVVIDGRSEQSSNDWPARHLLAGIAVCGVCGAGTRVGKQNAGKKRFDEDGSPIAREHYNTYICIGTPGKTGFHVAMKEQHLDRIVVDVVLARLERPDFLARLGQADDNVDAERQALIDEIDGHQKWLEEVHAEAERRRDLQYLTRQEDLVLPKIKAAQARLESLAGVDPVILELAKSGRVRQHWAAREKAGDYAWRRHVIRELVVPLIMRVPQESIGRRGLNRERVKFRWR